MKYLIPLCILLFVINNNSHAQQQTKSNHGYEIKVDFNHDIQDEYIYLAHYFGKGYPTVYRMDSAKVNNKSAVFQRADSILGGIYLVLFNENKQFFEFVLDNGNKMEIAVDTTDLPRNIKFKNSPENTRYIAYGAYLSEFGKKQVALNESLQSAKTAEDTAEVRKKSQVLSAELTDYRKDYIKKYPNTFLSSVFNTLIPPESPKGPHYLEDGKTIDSTYDYRYYKAHYWDNFNFKDERLIHSPIMENKLTEYFTRLVLPIPDSMNYEADQLLDKLDGTTELYKYTLHWLVRHAETSKVMGMDEVFVYLVENYYMKGKAFWLDEEMLGKYEDRAQKIAPNVLGNTAPELTVQDVWTLQNRNLSDFESKYTVLMFWSPTCPSCLEELPKMDSMYHVSLKEKGVKVFSIPTDGDLSEIQKLIEKENLKEWTHSVDAYSNTDYRNKYDVYSTPRVYLLDEHKTIIGKGLSHSDIEGLIKWHENKNSN